MNLYTRNNKQNVLYEGQRYYQVYVYFRMSQSSTTTIAWYHSAFNFTHRLLCNQINCKILVHLFLSSNKSNFPVIFFFIYLPGVCHRLSRGGGSQPVAARGGRGQRRAGQQQRQQQAAERIRAPAAAARQEAPRAAGRRRAARGRGRGFIRRNKNHFSSWRQSKRKPYHVLEYRRVKFPGLVYFWIVKWRKEEVENGEKENTDHENNGWTEQTGHLYKEEVWINEEGIWVECTLWLWNSTHHF